MKRTARAATRKSRPSPSRAAKRKKPRKPARAKRSKRAPPVKRKRAPPVKRKRAPPVKRKRAKRSKRSRKVRAHDLDVAVQTGGFDVAPGYRPYPLPRSHKAKDLPSDVYQDALLRLQTVFDKGGPDARDHAREILAEVAGESGEYDADEIPDDYVPEIEWLPTFDEVYDYIDALVEEYDLDAHELFELAFGYSDDAAV